MEMGSQTYFTDDYPGFGDPVQTAEVARNFL